MSASRATPNYELAGDLKIGQVGIANLRVRTLDVARLGAEMRDRVARAPKLFERAAVIVDFGGLPGTLYTDHGSDFISQHLEQVAADLHVRLTFSTAGALSPPCSSSLPFCTSERAVSSAQAKVGRSSMWRLCWGWLSSPDWPATVHRKARSSS